VPRILVIDDDATMRQLLRMHLAALQHSVEVAADASEAIRSILARTPDLIISDLNMPYMDGLELLKALRGDDITKAVPVIMITGSTSDEHWMEAMKLGVTRYVVKPVQIEELIKEIDLALKSSVPRQH
jgi:two-component system, chemotaxis family, chemotaxis protein CheY